MKSKPRITLKFGHATKPDPSVVVHAFVGPFAVHLFMKDHTKKVPCHWTVTHVTSGMRACFDDQTFDSKQNAVAWANHLLAFGDWSAETLDQCNEAVREWRRVSVRLISS